MTMRHHRALSFGVFWMVLTVAQSSRFMFNVAREQECFLEQMDARASNNRMLFRFGMIDPEDYDFVDVWIVSPSGQTLLSWNKTRADHTASTVRETGLYQMCFKRLPGSSTVLRVSYSFDFISTGSVALIIYPMITASLTKNAPMDPIYNQVDLETSNHEILSMGLVDFELRGVSSSSIDDNTRVQLVLSVTSLSSDSADIELGQLPDSYKPPFTWNQLSEYITSRKQYVLDSAEAKLGGSIMFDITELFSRALRTGKDALTFTFLPTSGDVTASLASNAYSSMEYYPQVIVEDLGLDLMRELAHFQEVVFELRGEIAYMKQNERLSRSAVESTNSRLTWASLLINVVLVGIAFGQVVHIRHMLEGAY